MYVQWGQKAHTDQTIAVYYSGHKNHDYVWSSQINGMVTWVMIQISESGHGPMYYIAAHLCIHTKKELDK